MQKEIKAKVYLDFDDNIIEPIISFSSSLLSNNNEYEIILTVNPNTSFKNNFMLTGALKKEIISTINMNNSLLEEFPDLLSLNNILTNILNGKISIFDTIDEIEFNEELSYDTILNYLNNNRVLQNKKITLGKFFSLEDEEAIKRVGKLFSNYPFLQIKLDGNIKSVRIIDGLKTIETIDSIVSNILKYNFSPLEQIMYTYDIIRNRVYQEEDSGLITDSRDLTQVLFGDKIVCLGYAKLFHHILNKLGIKNAISRLDGIDNLEGHARNVIYIKDNKYDIDGIYFFDPTWDSKKEENNDDYLSSYRYFAKTKSYFANIDKKNLLIDKNFQVYDVVKHYIYACFIENKMFDSVPIDYVRTINHISNLVDDGLVNISYMKGMFVDSDYLSMNTRIEVDKIIPKLEEYANLLNRPISTDKLIQVLLNVRKILYYEKDNQYPFSLEEFNKIAINSLWSVKKKVKTSNEYILKMQIDMEKYDKLYSLNKQINQVKVAKTLRKIYDKKTKIN